MKILEFRNDVIIVDYNNKKYVRSSSICGCDCQLYNSYIDDSLVFIFSSNIEKDFKIAMRKYKLDSL